MPNSIESIIRTYSNMIYKIAFSITKNKSDADDIFQEVFLKYVTYKDKCDFVSEEHLKNWLIRVCINFSKNYVSSGWKKNVDMNDDEFYINISSNSKFDEQSTMCLDLKNALNKISDRYQLIIYLYYYEQLSVKNIAIIMNSSEVAIRKSLERARNALKRELGGDYYFE